MSNKTQLATNNTQLASLIQTLQGKAGGGAGGGEIKIATGTFSNSTSYPAKGEKMATVQGVGFKPICVIVTVNTKFTFGTTGTNYVVCVYYVSGNTFALRNLKTTSSTAGVYPGTTDIASIVPTDDGFELYNGNFTNVSYKDSKYTYYALGN